jgi:hypothetical protein
MTISRFQCGVAPLRPGNEEFVQMDMLSRPIERVRGIIEAILLAIFAAQPNVCEIQTPNKPRCVQVYAVLLGVRSDLFVILIQAHIAGSPVP